MLRSCTISSMLLSHFSVRPPPRRPPVLSVSAPIPSPKLRPPKSCLVLFKYPRKCSEFASFHEYTSLISVFAHPQEDHPCYLSQPLCRHLSWDLSSHHPGKTARLYSLMNMYVHCYHLRALYYQHRKLIWLHLFAKQLHKDFSPLLRMNCCYSHAIAAIVSEEWEEFVWNSSVNICR